MSQYKELANDIAISVYHDSEYDIILVLDKLLKFSEVGVNLYDLRELMQEIKNQLNEYGKETIYKRNA